MVMSLGKNREARESRGWLVAPHRYSQSMGYTLAPTNASRDSAPKAPLSIPSDQAAAAGEVGGLSAVLDLEFAEDV